MRRSVFRVCLGGALAAIAGYAGSAQASFPGTNGKIVFLEQGLFVP
jgi:hypothetical protein